VNFASSPAFFKKDCFWQLKTEFDLFLNNKAFYQKIALNALK